MAKQKQMIAVSGMTRGQLDTLATTTGRSMSGVIEEAVAILAWLQADPHARGVALDLDTPTATDLVKIAVRRLWEQEVGPDADPDADPQGPMTLESHAAWLQQLDARVQTLEQRLQDE
jgi:hypothetical protein